jgi:hypothetical protein
MSFVFFRLIGASVVARVKASRKKISWSKFDFGVSAPLRGLLFEFAGVLLWVQLLARDDAAQEENLFADNLSVSLF